MPGRARTDYRCDTCGDFSWRLFNLKDPVVYNERKNKEKGDPLACKNEGCDGRLQKIYPILGPTRLADAQRCMFFFDKNYNRREKFPRNIHLAFGSKIHEILDGFYKTNFQSEESFINYWSYQWGRVKRGEDNQIGEVRIPNEKARPYVMAYYGKLGREILSSFYRRHIDKRRELEERRNELIRSIEEDRKEILRQEHRRGAWKVRPKERKKILKESMIFPKTETDFIFEWRGHYLRGRMDIIYEQDGGLSVSDFKTSKFAATPQNDLMLAGKPHQASTYHLAMKDLYDEYPRSVSLYYLRNGTIVNIPIIDDHLELLDQDLTETEEKIKAGDFRQNIGMHCRWCDAYGSCLKEAKGKLPPPGLWDEDDIEKYWGTDLEIL